jgi:ParB-like chromosome segregation protein Spo0J
MMSPVEPIRRVAPAVLRTSLARARFLAPTQVERMQQALSRHGQLTPLVVVAQKETLEIVDGFKRQAAGLAMALPELTVRVMDLDPAAQWAAMLQLNRPSSSMTEVEEALVLRELLTLGLSQVEVGALVGRHKAWVSRRVGLVERLHPELIASLQLGLLRPGVARRLLALPQGNQLQLAAAAQQARLGPRETERLVSLWRRAEHPDARRFLLAHPREALAQAYPKPSPPTWDPWLSQRGQQILRLLRLLEETLPRLLYLLETPATTEETAALTPTLRKVRDLARRLESRAGSFASCTSDGASGASGATT